jgi:hypothetical protein
MGPRCPPSEVGPPAWLVGLRQDTSANNAHSAERRHPTLTDNVFGRRSSKVRERFRRCGLGRILSNATPHADQLGQPSASPTARREPHGHSGVGRSGRGRGRRAQAARDPGARGDP